MEQQTQIGKNAESANNSAFEKLIHGIKAGLLTEKEASHFAVVWLADTSRAIRAIDFKAIESMSIDDAHGALDSIASAKEAARCAERLFEKYPEVALVAKTVGDAIFYAEAALSPMFLLGCNQPPVSKSARVSTYIVRNPASELIKIGKTCDMKSRMQALTCGSGVPLEILAVIPSDIEQDLHKQFAHIRVRGEWFDDHNLEIRAYLKDLKNTSTNEVGA
jgi:hypothetical protein